MKGKNSFNKIIRILLLIIISILFLCIIREIFSYQYVKTARELYNNNYNNRQRNCEVVGLTENYIYVLRYDENEKPIQGSKWKVTNILGEVVGEFITDENGEGGIVGLDFGEYYIKEESVPEKCSLNENNYKFIISEIDNSFIEVITDVKNSNHVLGVVLDEQGNPVENIKYALCDKDENIILELKSNEKGLFAIKNLKVNELYYIRELDDKYSEKHYFYVDNLDSLTRIDIIYSEEEK